MMEKVFEGMMKQNKRLVAFTVTVLALLVTVTFLPAFAQLSQWRSLNPTRDGTIAPGGLGPILYSVHLLSPSIGWAVGGTCDIYSLPVSACPGYPGTGYALYWDGTNWREVLTPAGSGTLVSVFAVSPNDVWAVGLGPTVIHWDGISWVAVSAAVAALGVDDLFSVFMLPGGTDGWAVGDAGGAAPLVDNIRWSGAWPTGAWSPGLVANLLPGAAVLRSVSLSSPTFGWIMGSGGQIFRWDGAGWNDLTPTSPVVGTDMLSVFAISGNDAWAVGVSDTIIRWNGASWTGPMVAPTTGVDYRSVKMVSATDGWIAGSVDPTSLEGTLLRWNGVAWSIVRSWVTADLNDIFLLPGGTAGWAVGDAETIIKWDNVIWRPQTSPTNLQLNSVYLTSSTDGWSVGDSGNIFRWDGISWSHYETLPSGQDLFGLYMRASTDAWAVGDNPGGAGTPPTILRWNGIAWTVVSPPGVALGERLNSVYMLSATEGWSVGSALFATSATVLKWDGTIWSSVPSGTATTDELKSVHMLTSTDGWAVGCDAACPITTFSDSDSGPVIIRWNGLAWSMVTPPNPGVIGGLWSVHMLSPTNGWAVGELATDGRLTIIHWDGTQWRRVPGPAAGAGSVLASVRMVNANDGWAVGVDPSVPETIIVHWDGVTWNVVATLPIPSTLSLGMKSVFTVSALDGWAVGEMGIILHYGPEIACIPTTTTTTTSLTSTVTTTITGTITTTGTTTTTSTTTTAPGGPVPGFPIESILAGLVAGVAVLAVLRHRPRRRS